MITLVNKDSLYNLFGAVNFQSLEELVEGMAPSLVEYHLSSLCEYSDEIYFNKRDVESRFSIGDYSLYIDYSENIYLEFEESSFEDSSSLW